MNLGVLLEWLDYQPGTHGTCPGDSIEFVIMFKHKNTEMLRIAGNVFSQRKILSAPMQNW